MVKNKLKTGAGCEFHGKKQNVNLNIFATLKYTFIIVIDCISFIHIYKWIHKQYY